jgi:hypothetical protein
MVCEYNSTANATDTIRRGKRSQSLSQINEAEMLPLPASTSASASTVWTSPQESSSQHLAHGAKALSSDMASFPISFASFPVHASYDRPSLFTLFGMNRQHPFRTSSHTPSSLFHVVLRAWLTATGGPFRELLDYYWRPGRSHHRLAREGAGRSLSAAIF